MSIRIAPPTRTSSSQRGAVKPSGGNQSASCVGSVHALYTRCRGASKTLVVTRVRSGAITLSPAAMSLFLPLQFAQMRVESIETLFPENAIALHPSGCFAKPRRLEPCGPPLRVASTRDQPRMLEHLEVLRDRGEGHVEGLRELSDGSLARCETCQDCPPRGVRDRGKGRAEVVGSHRGLAYLSTI